MSIVLLFIKERNFYMSANRKSNWYIYLAAFGVTLAFVLVAVIAFQWYLFPDEKTQNTVNSNGEVAENYKPTAKDNFNVMFMLSEEKTANPGLFMMIEYNAAENRIVLIPVSSGISVSSRGKTLENIFESDGGQGVVDVMKEITGVSCESYAIFDKKAFTDIVQSFGNVKYNVPKTVIITDNFNAETINAGEKLFSADTLFSYIMKVDFGEGELYRFSIIGEIFAELINQNFRDLDASRLSSFFSAITSGCETNGSWEQFNSHKAPLLYTIEYGASPAEYYIPYGEYTSDGGFKVSDNSLMTIKQKAGLQ